ncbi:MAG: hypothetical protein Q4Q62_02075 [Thermoplasmata archaeon]|nr:hypothetical protein [Thermoplasmata archaeon]
MTAAERRLVNEAPTVVGLVTSVIESGGSLDLAVRAVAAEGPALSRAMFASAVREADTKGYAGVRAALEASLSGVSGEAAGYRQAMMLCVSASEASDRAERLRILEDASSVALDAVRIMGERYSASLTTPCMAVFALGIMAPMILMSILPMLSIGGLFGAVAVDGDLILLATLVLVPAAILAMAWSIRAGNPFITERPKGADLVPALFLAAAVPMAAAMLWTGHPAQDAILFSVAVAAVSAAVFMYPGVRAESSRAAQDEGLRDCVFEMGNSLLGGDNFEKAAVDSLSSRPECASVGTALGREMDLCRGDVPSALVRAVSPVSPAVSRTLCDIQRCSVRDTDDAGRLAVAMGRQFQNESNTRRELGVRLKSMTDMMAGTAVFFAPLVLGLSVSMLGPLSQISGYEGLPGAEAAISVYLVELCALISVLMSSLGEGAGARRTIWRFCVMAPISLAVFALCTSIQLRRD